MIYKKIHKNIIFVNLNSAKTADNLSVIDSTLNTTGNMSIFY